MKGKSSAARLSAAAAVNRFFVPVCLALAVAAFLLHSPLIFFSRLDGLVAQSAKMLIIVSGLTLVMVSGGIDVSIGGQISLVIVCMSLMSSSGWRPVPVIFGGIAVGAACGALNGFVVSVLRIPPFVATLTSNYIFYGIAKTFINHGISFSFQSVISDALSPGILYFHLDFLIAIICLALTWFLLNRTFWGRHVVAIGINESVARRGGINAAAIKWRCYFGSGLFCAVGAIVLFGNEGVDIATVDIDVTLEALAAVYLGNAAILRDENSAARAHIWKTAAAVFLLELLNSWMLDTFGGVYLQQIATSVLLILVLALDRYNRKRFSLGGLTP